MTTYNDYPLDDCLRQAGDLIERGATVHQKFTCAKCGSRQTMAEPNKFFTDGRCEKCGYVTNIRARGCNYLVISGGVLV